MHAAHDVVCQFHYDDRDRDGVPPVTSAWLLYLRKAPFSKELWAIADKTRERV
jgi:hypothetical protein